MLILFISTLSQAYEASTYVKVSGSKFWTPNRNVHYSLTDVQMYEGTFTLTICYLYVKENCHVWKNRVKVLTQIKIPLLKVA